MPRKLTTEEFIDKAKQVHGDKFLYDKVEYKAAWEKVLIGCREHGYYLQAPANHISGAKCPKCRIERVREVSFISQDEFIARSKEIHDAKYDYSKVCYRGCYEPVEITCYRHGSFFQIPNTHLTNHGCPKCASERRGILSRSSTKKFIKKAIEIHGNLYDYSLVEYSTTYSRVNIICQKHGVFTQRPSSHLSGQGCSRCGIEKTIKRSTTEEFIEKAWLVHGNLYDYSLVEYITAHSRVNIICPKHGKFSQKAYIHLSGRGCPICKSSKGELKIRNLLISLKIDFETQKQFPDCGTKRFDFYFAINNNHFLIEYDGPHHFQPIDLFGGNAHYARTKHNDSIKNQFAAINGFILIRIPYTEFDNIESILESEITKYTSLDL